ncbi:MAG: GNAT family N-acetyltransferase [Spirochaetes bacterium]|nr:GNAT family N-acetyltransferase [Spirochaetota bacterium]
MTLRKAQNKDIDNLFLLGNDSLVRNNSFNNEKINYDEHLTWFYKIQNDPNKLLLIIEENNDFLGQIRFDFTNHNEAVISISIVKKYRGKGLGKQAISKATAKLKKLCPNIKYIIAYIKINNEKSIQLFEKCNFKKIKEIIIKDAKSFEFRFSMMKKY